MRSFRKSAMSAVVVVAGLLLVAGCSGSQVKPEPEITAEPPSKSEPQELRARAITVLDDGADGPQMCYMMLTSYPPQCGGPAVHGWDWSKVRHEKASGVRWGEFDLVGTWANNEFTLTQDPMPPSELGAPDMVSPYAPQTRCSEAELLGKATRKDLKAAVAVAESISGYGDVWIDKNLDEALITEQNANDPERIILNVTTTGELGETEAAIREVWQGRLCVSPTRFSRLELEEIRDEVQGSVAQVLLIHLSVGFDRVTLGVWLDVDDALQKQFDDKYGAGVVLVRSYLVPEE